MSGKGDNKFGLIIAVIVALLVGLAAGSWLQKSRPAPEQAAQDKGAPTLYTCPMHPQVIQDHPGTCPICGMTLVPVDQDSSSGPAASKAEPKPSGERKVLYWVAPMDPTYISDKPGKSPMGMDLVPVYEGEEPGGGGSIKIDPQVVQNLGVRTGEARSQPLSRSVRAVGTFEVNEGSLAVVNTKIEGWIERLYVDETGQRVKRGQALLSIYSPTLVTTQEEYLSALNYYQQVKDSPLKEVVDSARSLLRASETRLKYFDVSSGQIKRLARTGRTTRTMTLYAPVSGVVMERKAVEGMKVMAGQELLRIANLSELWLQMRFYEQDAPWVHVGDRAVVTLDALPGATIEGRVSYIYPYLDSRNRDLTARVVVKNPDGLLKPGMYATAALVYTTAQPVVTVPEEAVIRSGERDLVFIDLGGGRFIPRQVTLGRYGDNHLVEVKSGLHDGERVVISAQFLIDSESNLQEAIQKQLDARKGSKTAAAPMKMKDGQTMDAGSGEKPMKMKPDQGQSPKPDQPMDMAPGSTMKMTLDPATKQGGATKTYYSCPMPEDQDVVTDHPGKCPKCGMDLEPVDELPYDHPLKHKH